ncbi:TPA: hypothetical protein REV55_002189 [Staphylococcus pseudintermedius]|nr:hypothetical protein [Staphylococcus pseudintermedius]
MVDKLLQKQVNKMQEKRRFGVNDEKAKFIVSILINTISKDENEEHKILLSILHNGYQYSRIIFPKCNNFDYIPLELEMEYLFNATV